MERELGHQAFLKLTAVDAVSADQVDEAIDRLAEVGPALGCPFADRISGSRVHNLKELRPGSSGRSEIRFLFVFDPTREAIPLVAGDKAGRWREWYRHAIPVAEERYAAYLADAPKRGKGQTQR